MSARETGSCRRQEITLIRHKSASQTPRSGKLIGNSMLISNMGMVLTCLAVVALLVLLPRRDVPAPGLTLLRCFFPAWRFFEEIAPSPVLSHRLATSGQGLDAADWVVSLVAPQRGLSSLWLNAPGNLYLAYQSLAERLLTELDDPGQNPADIAQSVSYRLVQGLVAERVRTALPLGAAGQFQFRLSDSADPTATLFVSEIHTL